jgi:Novel toxin 10
MLNVVTFGGISALEQLGSKFVGAVDSALVGSTVATNNPVSGTLAHGVSGNLNPSMLGAPGAEDVFVTNAKGVVWLKCGTDRAEADYSRKPIRI